jgi:hypothetical protein
MTRIDSPTSRHRGAACLAIVLFVVCGSIARSVDVARAGYGVKQDEATYVSMALSLAFDRDLTYERRDLERFEGLYHSGPEGIFLKRGRVLSIHGRRAFPFVEITSQPDPRTDRLYFSKALVYPLVGAPFVKFFGLNGLLLLHVLLLTGVGICGYVFLAARSSSSAAATFTTAFLGASVLPVYSVMLLPEIFTFSLVFFALFLWLYKEVAPSARFSGRWTDIASAVLLGIVTYSKPPYGLLVTPLVVLFWWRRQWNRGFAAGACAVTTAAALFVLNAAVTGDFNYQGGDRKTFYSSFPFESAEATFQTRGGSVSTDGGAAQEVLRSSELPARFAHNAEYFLIGRYFGLMPYFFPGVVAILAWLFSPARRDVWRGLLFATCVTSAVVMLLILPYTWSGGGGPPGNRYFIGIYPTLFFLVPPLPLAWPAVVAWSGGALFTAKMLMSPFIAAKYPYLAPEQGLLRRLPVELTMANDLPVMLEGSRSHIPYRNDPLMLLYFLDQNAFAPEPPGMWVSGGGRAEILVRTLDPFDHLSVSAESPIRTVLTVSLGGPVVRVPLTPGTVATFDVPARGVRGLRSYSYLMSAQSSEGFVPHLQNPQSPDLRNLGALMRFRAVPAAP